MSDNTLQRPFTSPPITVPVTDAPVRVGVLNPPYTLINLSTDPDDTIWLADNSGVQVSQGTPLYPGTSLQWNRPGSLFAITETEASLLVSYDVTDWEANPVAIATAILNSGLILVDQPVLLFNGNRDNNATDIFDTSTFQSLLITISPVDVMTFPTALGRYDLIFFNDDLGTFQVFQRTIKFSDNAGNAGPWKGVLPCVGGGFRLSAVGTASGADIQIWGSYRPLHMMQQTFSSGVGNFHFSWDEIINAGSSSTLPIAPYIGTLDVRVAVAAGAHATSRIQWNEETNGISYLVHTDLFNQIAAPWWQAGFTLAMGGGATRLQVFNNDAAQRTFYIRITASQTQVGDA